MYKDSIKLNNEFPSQRQFISLLYACPFVNTNKTCVLSKIRNKMQTINLNDIEKFEKEKIFQLLSEHNKCFIKRTKSNGIELKSKKYHKSHKIFAYLKWTDKVNIGFLTSGLKKRNWIKLQSEFARLFDNTDIKHKVHCNMQYKYEVAYLLFRLKEENFYYAVNTKGYFKIAEQHIVDYSGKSLPKNTLKYISSKINRMPAKYHVIIKEVEEIINEFKNHSNNY